MTRIDRIKEHLGRHGYEVPRGTKSGSPLEESNCRIMLRDFLADKAMTGARIKDLDALDIGIKISDRKWRATLMRPDGHKYVLFADADTPDEAISALWVKVFIDAEEDE